MPDTASPEVLPTDDVPQNGTPPPEEAAHAPRETGGSSPSAAPAAFGTSWRDALFIGAVITALAFAVRLFYLLEYRQDPTFHLYILDTQYNDTLAREIASGKGAPPHAYFRTPGYPYFLALLRMIFPEGMFGVRFVQVVLGALGCGLTAVLGARMFSRSVAWIAGAVTSLYGPLIVVSPELLSPVLSLPLNLGFLICLVEGWRSRRWVWWAGAGLLTGLSGLVRPDVLPVAALLGVLAGLSLRPRAAAPRLLAAFILTCSVPIAVTATRNWVVGKEFVLIGTQGGVNFYIGNNPQSDGTSVEQPGKTTWGGGWEDTKADAEKEVGRPLTFSEASTHFFRKGLASYVQAPLPMLKLNLRKLFLFWHGMELPNNKDEYASRYYSWVAALTYWHRGLYFPFGVFGPLLLAACVWCWREDFRHRLLILYTAGYCLIVIAFFVTGRYRLPVVPAGAILVGIMATELAARLRSPGGAASLARAWRLRGAAAVTAAGLVAFNLPGGADELETRCAYQTMKGLSLLHLDRTPEAIEALQKAIAANPTSNGAAINNASVALASAYRMVGDLPAAEGMYRQILSRFPENSTMMSWLGEVVLEQGRVPEARQLFESAVRLDPQLADAHTGLAAALMDMNDVDGARRHFLEADRLAPTGQSKTNLGMLCGRTGDYAAAMKYFEEALAIDPSYTDARVGMALALNAQGRTSEAREHLRQALRASPPSPRAQALAAQWGVAP